MNFERRAPYAEIMIGQLVCKSEGDGDSTVLFLIHNT